MKENTKKIVYGFMIFVCIFMIAMLTVAKEQYDTSVNKILETTIIQFLVIDVMIIVTMVFIYLGKRMIRWIDRDAMSTCIHFCMLKFNEHRRSKNFQSIYPWLRSFLFSVLKDNNDYLNLPLGKDATCLSPFNCAHSYCHGCVFYLFQLILPETLEHSEDELRALLQAQIVAELRNYGIPGLYAVYTDRYLQKWDSVYVDRITVDEDNKILTFSVLYVSSETALARLKHALDRDSKKGFEVKEVYDDELN